MKRLYRKVYLTILGSLVLVVVLSGLIWQFGGQRSADVGGACPLPVS